MVNFTVDPCDLPPRLIPVDLLPRLIDLYVTIYFYVILPIRAVYVLDAFVDVVNCSVDI